MFDKSTWIRLPRHVLVGHEVLGSLGEVVSDLQITGTPLIVTSPTPNRIAGDSIHDLLEAEGLTPETVVIEEATFDVVEQVASKTQEIDASILIAIGGGKVIDVAKMAGNSLNTGFLSVPTTASHDGIVSGRSSIPEEDTRHSIAANPPLGVIADTSILADAPWRLTTAGCADIISNYTAVKDWRLAERLQGVEYSEYAGALSEMTAELLVESAETIRPGLEESAWIVVKALVSSGVAMSIAGSSRPASGAEHLFSHQLDRISPNTALHGHQVGIGAIMTDYLHSGDAGRWRDIRDALAMIGAPTTAKELDIEPSVVIDALTSANEIRDRYTILGNGISKKAAREVAVRTGVIEPES